MVKKPKTIKIVRVTTLTNGDLVEVVEKYEDGTLVKKTTKKKTGKSK